MPKQSKKTASKKNAGSEPEIEVPFSKSAPNKSTQNEQKAAKDDGYMEGGKTRFALKELTPEHKRFCRRYVLCGRNARRAARETGFSEWYGSNQLMGSPLIKAEVERYAAERAKKFEVSEERIVAELCKVAFGNLDDFLTLRDDGTPVINCEEVGRDEMAALAEITQDVYMERTGSDPEDVEPVKKTKIKLHSKLDALGQLSRIFRMQTGEDPADKGTPEEKAAKIRKAMKAMREADGD